MLAKYVIVILFKQFIPNPCLTKNLISRWAVFDFRDFLHVNSEFLAKGCVERAKSMQSGTATDPSFVFCSVSTVCLVLYECPFARLQSPSSALHRQISTDV